MLTSVTRFPTSGCSAVLRLAPLYTTFEALLLAGDLRTIVTRFEVDCALVPWAIIVVPEESTPLDTTPRLVHHVIHRPTMSRQTRHLPSTPISIAPSAAEVKSRKLNQRNLEIATRALSRDGLVVLEDMVDHAVLDRLNQKMVQDALELQARKDSPFNYNRGNIQQDPPLTQEWFSDEIYISTCSVQPGLRSPKRILTLDHRPHRYASHFDYAGSCAFIAFHIRQHRATTNCVIATSLSADPQRCRL